MPTTVLEANGARRPVKSGQALPVAVYALTGFSGLLAVLALEKYLQLLTGPGAPSAALTLISYFLGITAGGAAAVHYLRRGRIVRPLRTCGFLELAAGLWCVVFAYAVHLLPAYGAFLLVLPAAIPMGAAFPLIARALDENHLVHAYAVHLGGALAAALSAPFLILPALAPRGALWICGATGAAICALTWLLAEKATAPQSAGSVPIGREERLLLTAAFASGAIFFALEVVWTHLIAATLDAGTAAFEWMLAGVLAGLLAGALSVNRPTRPALLFQSAALLLTLQFTLWDRLPLLSALLIVPVSAVLGLIYPQLLGRLWTTDLAGYLWVADSFGCVCGALAGILVLLPLVGSEVALKGVALTVALVWCVFLLRERPSRARLLRATAMAAALAAAILGRWWDWGRLGAGQAPVAEAVAASSGARFLPASLIFKHEDTQGGFTTVVEQTVVAGGAAHTVRTLFNNGRYRGDDAPGSKFGASAIPSLFVPDYGRALLVGLGTGRSALDLKLLGYREIVIAEPSRGIVKAAAECFRGFNEAILDDPLFLESGRNVLLANPRRLYDLIAVESAPNADTREFYALAHSRLQRDGALQQWVSFDRASPRVIAQQLSAAGGVFPFVGLWYYGRHAMLIAANHPLVDPRLQLSAKIAPEEIAKLIDGLLAARVLDSAGVERLVNDRSLDQSASTTLEFLRKYR